jgi:hypothetical protein
MKLPFARLYESDDYCVDHRRDQPRSHQERATLLGRALVRSTEFGGSIDQVLSSAHVSSNLTLYARI